MYDKNHIDDIYKDLLDPSIEFRVTSPQNLLLENKETIFKLTSMRDKKTNIRQGNLVDQCWADKYIKHCNTNPIFTIFDCVGENVVNFPLGFIPCDCISQTIDYYRSYSPAYPKYHNKVFWSGSGFTHNIRPTLIDFIQTQSQSNKNIDVNYWKPDGNPYGKIKPQPSEYTKYFERLKSSDIFLVIRGDLPWLNSFFDALRAGCIPVCIDTFYANLGWENIGIKTEDIILDLHTNVNSLDEIYEKIIELVSNKDKVLHMKDTIRNFYNKYILTDRYLNKHHTRFHLAGWGDFYVAKVLELVENNYQIKNNQFICAKVKEIKNI